MLEQPVPNPLATNPNFHTHKVLAAVGLILIVLIIVTGGVWYFVQSAEDKASSLEDSSVKVSTSSAKTSTKDETLGWLSYTSTEFNFSLKYPTTWKTKSCSEDGWYGLGPTESNTGSCSSGNFPTILIADGAKYSNTVDSSYSDYKTENLTIDSKSATKTSGITKGRSDIQDGVYMIEYTFANKSIFIRFTGNKIDTENLSVLDKTLSTFKFL